MKKDTNELLKELKNFDSFQSFFEENKENISAVSLNEALESLIEKKGLNRAVIVLKCTQIDPQSRFGSVYDLIGAL